ncbi:9467_t:CDS:2 [Dentiscutata heterogama]|uniref:9467_t:CDS:1 n=1 Tax=Dentiscutata heterogama TaxID=1316150 RepID=A0ACA9KV78_9GLOM|nr:9467_t:CDS:2 [Dentiscutata heterogama]
MCTKSKNLKKDRISTRNIYDELLNYVKARDIEKKDVSQILTIQNWIIVLLSEKQ